MLRIAGYEFDQTVYESDRTVIYRGIRSEDHIPVIAKLLRAEFPPPDELEKMEREYNFLNQLDIPGIVKTYSLEATRHNKAIIMEDFGAISLESYLRTELLSFIRLLEIAITITGIIKEIHSRNIIHRDINPGNILLNSRTGEIKIIDFGSAIEVARDIKVGIITKHFEGTPAYLSPEQTGRMNRLLDYRTDYYSLGVSFYRMFTRELPFQTKDIMELVHAHITREPLPPHKINSDIPFVISEIILKLLSKTAEARYQSASGLINDLTRCLNDLKAVGNIPYFKSGYKDFSKTLRISKKLYGRQKEERTLFSAFNRVYRGGKEMLLVSGYSGIGKTSVVHEIHKSIIKQRGYYISGKFDQLKRNIPLASLIQAFQDLTSQLLTESDRMLSVWKEKLAGALGPNGQVIIDVIPELEHIIGPQPAVAELPPGESKNRFNLVFQDFVRTFLKREHPLIIFFDDLQWVDPASLDLLKIIITDPGSRHLLIIGAYRDNEVSSTHPLMLTLDELRKKNVSLNTMTLHPLGINDVAGLITDTLHCDTEYCRSLTNLVFAKTKGNPFYINLFLKSLYDEELLQFSLADNQWHWKDDEINKMKTTDNVIDLMISKIHKLQETSQLILKLAACIGNQFDLKTLAVIFKKSTEETAVELMKVVMEGLILLPEEQYSHEGTINKKIIYTFLHDRVQQASYSLITEEEKAAIHLQIGQWILSNSTKEEVDERIFEVVNHLNEGSELIKEKEQLIELDLSAGIKAKDSTAYKAALLYFEKALSMFPVNIWERNYHTAYQICLNLGECSYLTEDYNGAEKILYELLEKTRTKLDKAEVYRVLMWLDLSRSKYQQALETGIEGLKLFQIRVPLHPGQESIRSEVSAIEKNLGHRKIEELADGPLLKDQERAASMRLLFQFDAPSYISGNFSLYSLCSMKLTNFSLQYGHIAESALGYATFAFLLISIYKDFDRGIRFGEMALKLSAKFPDLRFRGKVNFLLGMVIIHWRKHLKNSMAHLKTAYKYSLQSGDHAFANFSALHHIHQGLCSGIPLRIVEKEWLNYNAFPTQSQYMINLMKVFYAALKALTEPGGYFGNKYIKEDSDLEIPLVKRYYYCFKGFTLYLFERYGQALEALETALALDTEDGLNQLTICRFSIFYALVLTAIYSKAGNEQKKKYLEILEAELVNLKLWGETCPENHLHGYLLVSAEFKRITGEHKKAMKLYDRAIKAAGDNDFFNEEALANELAAKFYLEGEFTDIAALYIKRARAGYESWGAASKIIELEEKYKELFSNARITTASIISSDINILDSLDLSSLIKASQAISGEMNFDKLLQRLLKIILESAGAQKGFVIHKSHDKLYIEASFNSDSGEIDILKPVQMEMGDELPESIVRYVARTGNNIVLPGVSTKELFENDRYIKKNNPKSILCIPIRRTNNITGVLYLENNMVERAFTGRQIKILEVLIAQAAISIENARNYCRQEDLVKQRTSELETMGEELESFNYSISHDLRAPLRSIEGFSRALYEDYYEKIDAEGKDYLDRIVNGTRKMNTLINEMLKLSRITMKEIAPGEINLSLMVGRIINGLRKNNKDRRIEAFITDDIKTVGDKSLIRIAMENILSNAVKYTSKRKIAKIEFGVNNVDGSQTYYVKDNGIGFDMSHKDKLFIPFQKLHSDSEFTGAGVGLSIVNRVIIKHGGKVWARSKEGEGAVFYFSFGNKTISRG